MGTRPEAIKMAPVIEEFASRTSVFSLTVCVTGQHRDLLDQALLDFGIKPDIDLNLMRPRQDLTSLTSSIMTHIQDVIVELDPDIVLVHGDTTTAFASALVAFYENVPVGHIEAGLRTHDVFSPFPEEFYRTVISKITNWHFAPTELSRQNLIAEGVHERSIVVTGNTVIDALLLMLNRIEKNVDLRKAIVAELDTCLNFSWTTEPYVLVTVHRRENLGEGIEQIFVALKALAHQYPNTQLVFPIHLNPQVREPAKALLTGMKNIHLLEPQSYPNFVYLLKHSFLVLTDSGGLQEEAPSLGKPVLVLRDVTERPEAMKAGTAKIVGTDVDTILSAVAPYLGSDLVSVEQEALINPFGDGLAARRILDTLESEIL